MAWQNKCSVRRQGDGKRKLRANANPIALPPYKFGQNDKKITKKRICILYIVLFLEQRNSTQEKREKISEKNRRLLKKHKFFS